jgi:hypothetical protein
MYPDPALLVRPLDPRKREPVARRTRRDSNAAVPRGVRSEPRGEHLFDTAKLRAFALVQRAHRMMDETVDRKTLSEGS